MTRQEFEQNCAHYADFAFYTPPDQFLFRHYDENKVLMCSRGVIGNNFAGDLYFVSGHQTTYREYYGAYQTRDVTYYLKSGTWIEVPSAEFFAEAKVAEIRRSLAEAEAELDRVRSCHER